MNKNFKYVAGFGLAVTALFSGGTAAFSQAKPKVQASGWFKTCNEEGENKICNTQFQIVTNTRQVVTALSLIEVSGKVNRKVFQIMVPTARSLPPGIQVTVDGKQSTAIPYAFCRPSICAAEVQLNDNLVKVFKAGGELNITSVNFQGTPNAVPVTLKGFTAAYDGPPVDQTDPAVASQEKLKKQLEDKVKSGEVKN